MGTALLLGGGGAGAGGSVPQKRMGREMDLKQKRCQTPEIALQIPLCPVSALRPREPLKQQALSYLRPQGHHVKLSPKGAGRARGAEGRLRGGCGAVLTCGSKRAVGPGLVYSPFGTEEEPHTAACAGKLSGQSHFSRLECSKAEEEEEEQRGLQRDGPRGTC